MTGNSFEIRANRVIFAGGPFTDSMREMEMDSDEGKKQMPKAVRGASGTHIVLPGYYCPNEVRSDFIIGVYIFLLVVIDHLQELFSHVQTDFIHCAI